MIITISGEPGSGKSTVGKKLATELRYKFISIGERFRKIAEKKGKNILELMNSPKEFAKIQEKVELYLDDLSQRDELVIDGRDAFIHIRDSFKIFLKVDDKVAAKRIFEADRIGKPEFKTVQESLEAMQSRKKQEQEIYKKLHNVNILDESLYDLVLDTTHTTVEEALVMIKMNLNL